MKEIPILTKKSSKAILDKDFSNLNLYINQIKNISKIILFSEEQILNLHSNLILDQIKNLEISIEIFKLKPGEKNKHISNLKEIFNFLVQINADRNCLIIAFGGGVVGDLAGFIASTYLRGVKYIQIPTTLLACVDSSIGGKVAVNADFGKNIIGSFYQPEFTYITTQVLKTLPIEEWQCGIAEVIKYGFLTNREFYEKIKSLNLEKIIENEKTLESIILSSVEYKIKIITEDEKESSLRKVLNLGHTTAHAIESYTKYQKYSHGQAVAIGLVTCIILSITHLNLNKKILDEFLTILQNYKLPAFDNSEPEILLKHMSYDKKNYNNVINFVLLESIGKTKIMSLTKEEILKAIITQNKKNN